MRITTVYSYAKEQTGPLTPSVKTVEEAVKSVVGPVYDKFHLVPDEILRHADTGHHHSVTHGTPAAPRATASEMATRLYANCEPVVEQCVASTWQRLKQFPLFPQVANAVVVPKAMYCTKKYNEAVVAAAEKGWFQRICLWRLQRG